MPPHSPATMGFGAPVSRCRNVGYASHVEGDALACEKASEILSAIIVEAERSREIVARAHGHHAKRRPMLYADAHDAVCDLVHHAVTAEGEHRVVVPCRFGKLDGMAHVLGIHELERGVVVVVEREEALQLASDALSRARLRDGVGDDERAAERRSRRVPTVAVVFAHGAP